MSLFENHLNNIVLIERTLPQSPLCPITHSKYFTDPFIVLLLLSLYNLQHKEGNPRFQSVAIFFTKKGIRVVTSPVCYNRY